MVAKPNPQKSLSYCRKLAHNQLKRVNDSIKTVEQYLKKTKYLTTPEKVEYRAFLKIAKQQQTAFAKVASLKVPNAKAILVAHKQVSATTLKALRAVKAKKKRAKARRAEKLKSKHTILTGAMFPSSFNDNGKSITPNITA